MCKKAGCVCMCEYVCVESELEEMKYVKRSHYGISNVLSNSSCFPDILLRVVFRHLLVQQLFINKQFNFFKFCYNRWTFGKYTHTWVLKSWVGSLGASSIILSMLDTYLEGMDKNLWNKFFTSYYYNNNNSNYYWTEEHLWNEPLTSTVMLNKFFLQAATRMKIVLYYRS